MGVTKYWQLEQAERERWREVVRWLYDKKGRRVTHAEIEAAMGEYENEQAYNHALEKADSQ